MLASTRSTPIPALVAASTLPDAIARRLAAALLAVADADELAPIRAALLLRRFAAVDVEAYATLRNDAFDTDVAGYPGIA